MKLSTTIIPTIEMTSEEENVLWDLPYDERRVCGKSVKHWFTSDGNNEMLLEGENIYRTVIIQRKQGIG